MENKSKLKYYLSGLIILIVIIIVIMLSAGSKHTPQQTQATNNAANTPTASTSATSVKNSISTNGLVGTWISSTQGKGMQGSGKVAFHGTTYQINFTGDVNLVIQKVEDNTGTGNITFSNLCLTVSGINKPAQCMKSYNEPVAMQISGNNIKYTGPTVLGASISLAGTYTNDSITGTFTRTSTSGTNTGTFSLIREKN